MRFDATEQDEGFFQPVNRRVDQTIGLVLTGLCVLLFFSAFLISILQFQSVTTQTAAEPARESKQPVSDIGGSPVIDQEPASADTKRSP